ncbi:MAG: MiaB/RimO family radical SAM methylthiotransferase [bacterium]|nr:MiaB/RimO family radical SAM methylthiotransferase [bacterium]
MSKTYFIKTFGCSANVADSERIAGLYERKGYQAAKTLEEADVVIINSCSVRQSAEHRVYGLVNNLTRRLTGSGPVNRSKIVLAGCMLRYGVTTLKEKLPEVDEFLRMEDVGFEKMAERKDKQKALVPIMEGCNNFCTYCVVPYSRGREKSRPFEDTICEVEKLANSGCKEIVLLGQNVNSYGKDLNQKRKFSSLIDEIHKIKGVEKISFLTSNPWDLTDDIIQSIKLPKVNKSLHLPVQSGDDEVLKKMNRHYSALQYIKLVEKIKKEIPEIKIGTDIIVGFPTETKEQFENTVKLCQRVKFEKAYIARYSPRSGTAAYKFKDDVPAMEKKRRWQILEKLINRYPRTS